MKIRTFVICSAVLVLTSCAQEFNRVCKITDNEYKYEYAKACFAEGKFSRAITLLQELVMQEKGTSKGQESLYMLAMAQYCDRDYESASQTFKRYCTSYSKGTYTENAMFYIGQSLYMNSPEPRLDQVLTNEAISSFQDFIEAYPDSKRKEVAQERLFALQDKLVQKELYSAKLYYDLGAYFGNCNNRDEGNNYKACIITAQNALNDYPYTSLREDFSLLIMKSKFELAEQSVDEKRYERYQDAEDECYGFINEYPDSKDKDLAEKYIRKCKEVTKEKENTTTEIN